MRQWVRYVMTLVLGGYDKNEHGLKNCCLGEYTVENTGANGVWGGDFKECIGGPGRFGWDSYNRDGVPLTKVTNTGKDGLKKDYELEALIKIYGGQRGGDVHRAPSFISANFWKDVEDKEFISSDSKVKVYFPPKPPQPFREIKQGRGEPYFVWNCMDRAKEVRHRIILLIREWNTQKEYNRFKESLGSSGDPDSGGNEGDLCDYFTADEDDLFARDAYCNDFLDLDDWQEYSQIYPEVIYEGPGE